MESGNASLKVECVNQQKFATKQAAKVAVLEYIGYYNTKRLHSSLGYKSPVEYEQMLGYTDNKINSLTQTLSRR